MKHPDLVTVIKLLTISGYHLGAPQWVVKENHAEKSIILFFGLFIPARVAFALGLRDSQLQF